MKSREERTGKGELWEKYFKLVLKSYLLPCLMQIISTAADGQTSVEIVVCQGEREMAKGPREIPTGRDILFVPWCGDWELNYRDILFVCELLHIQHTTP